jgi:ATP-dependent protease Clp ATPase subunit
MSEEACSFCGVEVQPNRAMAAPAGAGAFICRDCIELCIDFFASDDALWRDQQIDRLKKIRKRRIGAD